MPGAPCSRSFPLCGRWTLPSAGRCKVGLEAINVVKRSCSPGKQGGLCLQSHPCTRGSAGCPGAAIPPPSSTPLRESGGCQLGSPRVPGAELHVGQYGSRAWLCPQQPGHGHGQCLWMCWGTRGPHPPPQSWRDNELMVTVRDALMGVGRSEPSKHLPEGRVNLRKASQRNNLLVNDHFLSSFAELPAGRRGLEGNCWSRWD